jgi:hypothetical protein
MSTLERVFIDLVMQTEAWRCVEMHKANML